MQSLKLKTEVCSGIFTKQVSFTLFLKVYMQQHFFSENNKLQANIYAHELFQKKSDTIFVHVLKTGINGSCSNELKRVACPKCRFSDPRQGWRGGCWSIDRAGEDVTQG
jgi:hypothetical protein